ncbi:MAG TPA: ABC transporter ATP-binding protein, partial [Frankiaceae bacterium]|nr:ABC transporter ATP-binding protein [Frankiaceae bacterium]
GYGPIAVLHGIDLDAAAGRLTVIVGPNGAGKTTLLKAISGLIPRRGEVLLDGEPLPGSPAGIVQRGVGHVPEGRQLFAQMTVLETLELGAWLVPRGDRSARLDEVLSAFPKLAERRTQLAGTMSGGEQQMLAVGRALMSDPKLLLVDEASMGLAPNLVEQLFDALAEVNAAGTSVLVVEQFIGMALRYTQRAYVLAKGAVAIEGRSADLATSEEVVGAYLGHGDEAQSA